MALCRAGKHDLTAENALMWTGTSHRCRGCHNDRVRESKRRIREQARRWREMQEQET